MRLIGEFASPATKMYDISAACKTGELHCHRDSDGRRWRSAEPLIRAWQSGATGDEQRELCPVCEPETAGRVAGAKTTRDHEARAVEQATELLLEAALSSAFRLSPRQEAVALASSAGQSKVELERNIELYRAKVRQDTQDLVRALVSAAASVAMSKVSRAAQSPRQAAEEAGWGHGLSTEEREALVLAERGLDPSPRRTAARAAVGEKVHPDQVWLSVRQVATITGVSAATIRDRTSPYLRGKAIPLHGHRDDATTKARWSFRRDVIEAWMQQKDLRTQIEVCGCERGSGRRDRRGR